MSREEFWEWLTRLQPQAIDATGHIHTINESIDEFGYVTVTFKVQEEQEDETIS
tara:strand:- start:287 stop:448 length:162 start_codon:yes stop_codon:yes gene_type:complete